MGNVLIGVMEIHEIIGNISESLVLSRVLRGSVTDGDLINHLRLVAE